MASSVRPKLFGERTNCGGGGMSLCGRNVLLECGQRDSPVSELAAVPLPSLSENGLLSVVIDRG